jgi:putative phage-type endonuclease
MHSDRSQWLEWRRKGIGASSVGALFDAHPFTTKQELWKSIVLGVSEDVETFYMKRGKEIEASVMPLLRQQFGLEIQEQVCLEDQELPIIRATLDGWVPDAGIVFEIKYINSFERYKHITAPPQYHRLQIQQQMMVANAAMGVYVCSQDGLTYKLIMEYPDLQIQREIRERVTDFWDNYVLTRTPPPSNVKDLKKRHDEECMWRCKRLVQIKNFVEEADQLNLELKELGGEQPYECLGVRYSCSPIAGGTRYKDIVELSCVQKALSDHGYKMSMFKNPPGLNKRITFPWST